MNTAPARMTFHVATHRVDAHRSRALCKQTEIARDTDLAGTLRRR